MADGWLSGRLPDQSPVYWCSPLMTANCPPLKCFQLRLYWDLDRRIDLLFKSLNFCLLLQNSYKESKPTAIKIIAKKATDWTQRANCIKLYKNFFDTLELQYNFQSPCKNSFNSSLNLPQERFKWRDSAECPFEISLIFPANNANASLDIIHI